MIHKNFVLNEDYVTSDFIEQCINNANVPQFLLKDTNNIMYGISLKSELYARAVMVGRYILKIKVTKEALFKD